MSINSINIDSGNTMTAKTDAIHSTSKVQNNNTIKNTTSSSNTATELRMLKDEIEEVNQKLQMSGRHCQFQVVEGTQRIAIKIIDDNTDEVLKEIPSEETIEVIKKLREMAGFLIDEQR